MSNVQIGTKASIKPVLNFLSVWSFEFVSNFGFRALNLFLVGVLPLLCAKNLRN